VRIQNWLGTSILALLGITIEVYGLRKDWPPFHLAVVFILALAGVILTYPRDRAKNLGDYPEDRRVIVRGDASGSSFERFWVKGADSFVDGDAKNASFRDIWFKARRRKR
jgi:hypothetical protein